MKFLTFVDLHGDKKVLKDLVDRAKQDDINFVICAGDPSVFGRGLREVMSSFDKLGKKFYIIPGNHESDESISKLAKDFPNCINFHKKVIRIDNYVILGYGEGGFSAEDPEFRKVSREWYGKYKGEKIVLVTHQPPFGTKLDKVEGGRAGNNDFRKFIERINPKLVIAGHIHETAGAVDKINKTRVVNPGWDGMVIELR
jgi:hypothetical protein